MKLILNNVVISAPIKSILMQLKEEIPQGLLDYIGDEKNDNILITCPHHKNGHENRPSCCVYCKDDNDKLEYGFYRCFTCGTQGRLPDLVSFCFHSDIEFAKQWLVDRFGYEYIENNNYLSDFIIPKNPVQYLDESCLENYAVYHPYLAQRHVPINVARIFKIGYDSETDSITFPIWDEHDRLLGVTKRSIHTKHFYIPKNINKPIYLLNFIIKNNLTNVYVTESQIDALNLWSWGFPAIALLGCGSASQYEILKKSGIRFYHLCLDGDLAGEKGCDKFKQAMPNDIFVDRICIPTNKDINDLSKEEFLNLPIK